MKKCIFTKLLCIVLVALMLVMSMGAYGSRNHAQFVNPQAESVLIYEELMMEFASQRSMKMVNPNEVNFPEYYGGAYIDEETGRLVVLIVADNMDDVIQNNIDNKNQVIIRSANISLNEMYETIAILSQNLQLLSLNGVDVLEISDDILNGRVNVKIKDLTLEKEEKIRNIIDKDYLYFSEASDNSDQSLIVEKSASPASTNAIALSAGHRVDQDIGLFWNRSTIGFPAKKGTATGFVVTGHVFQNSGIMAYHNGVNIGTSTTSAFYNNSTADAAFISKSANAEIADRMRNGGEIMGTVSSIINMSVVMYGDSSGSQSGKITSTNATVQSTTDPSVYFIKQCIADYSSQGGDSGAPILFYEGNFGGVSMYSIVGIHRSAGGCYSNVQNIKNELGVDIIT